MVSGLNAPQKVSHSSLPHTLFEESRDFTDANPLGLRQTFPSGANPLLDYIQGSVKIVGVFFILKDTHFHGTYLLGHR